jgi:hypothetical protein
MTPHVNKNYVDYSYLKISGKGAEEN